MDLWTDGWTDGRTDGQIDGHNLLQRCIVASKKCLLFWRRPPMRKLGSLRRYLQMRACIRMSVRLSIHPSVCLFITISEKRSNTEKKTANHCSCILIQNERPRGQSRTYLARGPVLGVGAGPPLWLPLKAHFQIYLKKTWFFCCDYLEYILFLQKYKI